MVLRAGIGGIRRGWLILLEALDLNPGGAGVAGGGVAGDDFVAAGSERGGVALDLEGGGGPLDAGLGRVGAQR